MIGEVCTDDRSLCIGFGTVSCVYSCALVLTCVLCTQSDRLMGTVSLSVDDTCDFCRQLRKS